MSTEKTTEKTTEKVEDKIESIGNKIEDKIENGMERMINAQEKMVEAFDTVSKRSLRVGEEWANTVSGAQQDMIATYRNIAKEPRAYAKNVETWMSSMTEMQKRSIDFAKLVYKEQTEAAEEMRDMMGNYLPSTGKINDSAKNWMGMWMKPFQAFGTQ